MAAATCASTFRSLLPKSADPMQCGGQRPFEIPQDHVVVVGRRVRMRSILTVEGEDRAAGEDATQMVVGPAVTKTQFDHWPGNGADQSGQHVEAIALGLHAAYETVETTHPDLQLAGTTAKLFSPFSKGIAGLRGIVCRPALAHRGTATSRCNIRPPQSFPVAAGLRALFRGPLDAAG
jgi:hypothetical protein